MFFRRVYRFSRALPALLAVSVLLPTVVVAGPSAADTDGFGDVDGGVHEPGINALADEGILDGTECGNGLFCPSEPILRSVMAVWLVRALGESPSEESGSRFSDVDSDEWWSPHVERLADLGVTAGCATDPLRFCPDKAVTRAQMATFLVRAFDLEAAASAGFADTGGNTHEDSIDTLAAADITAGCGTDPLRYCPSKSVTRAQMATFLARALDLIPKPRSEPEPETTSQPLLAYTVNSEEILAYYLENASGTYQNRFAEASYDGYSRISLQWSPGGNYLFYTTSGGGLFIADGGWRQPPST